MKNYVQLYILILAICGFSACKKDTITVDPIDPRNDTQISGNVSYDTDGDDLADAPVVNATVIYYDYNSALFTFDSIPFSRLPDSLLMDTLNMLVTHTDDNGDYRFQGLAPADNKALSIIPDNPYGFFGTDITPDGDDLETEQRKNLPVALEANEHDDGNNFIVRAHDTSISGSVLKDTDADGIGDEPVITSVRLYRRNPDGSLGGVQLSVATESNGNYEINNVPDGEYYLEIDVPNQHELLFAADDTPDPDGASTLGIPNWIFVNLENEEADADNNFIIVRTFTGQLTGFVLADTDNDLVGDLPLDGHRIELYRRTAGGVPQAPTLQAFNTDAEGFFYFNDVEPGEYVLYHIGTGAYPYECIEGADLSPEPGEPTVNVECSFIQVDIPSTGHEDADNVFLLKKL